MSHPFFSVIMPVFNRAAFLNTSIPSVLNQTFTGFELICVDDGSTDSSKEIINNIQKQDSRIKLLSLEKNYGRCIARNRGIETAIGEWICFLDSDDIYYSNHLYVFSELIKSHPEFFAFATEQAINGKRKIYNSKKFSKNKVILELQDFIRSNPVSLNQFCFSKKLLNIKFPDENIPVSEDWLFLRMVSYLTPIFKINVITNNVADHESRTVNTFSLSEIVRWNLYTANLFIKQNELSEKIKNTILSYINLLAANILLSEKEKKQSLKYFKSSLKYIYTYFDILFYKALLKYLLPK